jgi:hypothetical protein
MPSALHRSRTARILAPMGCIVPISWWQSNTYKLCFWRHRRATWDLPFPSIYRYIRNIQPCATAYERMPMGVVMMCPDPPIASTSPTMAGACLDRNTKHYLGASVEVARHASVRPEEYPTAPVLQREATMHFPASDAQPKTPAGPLGLRESWLRCPNTHALGAPSYSFVTEHRRSRVISVRSVARRSYTY